MTLENIIKLIRLNVAPFWRLSLLTGVEKTTVGAYQCENMPDTANDAERIAASIDALDNYLKNFENAKGQVFAIEMRKSKTANGGAVFGWFPFSLEVAKVEPTEILYSGLGSLGVTEQLSNLRDSMNLDFERKLFELEKRNFETAKAQTMRDLVDKKKEVEKKSAPVSFALEKVLGSILSAYAGGSGGTGGLGSQEDETEIVSEPVDERAVIAERIAQKIYESKLTVFDLENFEMQIQ